MADFATSADLPDPAKGNAFQVTAWLLLWDGMPKAEVARALKKGDRTIYRWITAWRLALGEPGLFKAGNPEQTAAMNDVRNERRLEVLVERDRLTLDLLDTAQMLNGTLQEAAMADDFDVLEGLRVAIANAEELEDDELLRRLQHQRRKLMFSGGTSSLKDIATALGIVTDKVIKLAEQISPVDGTGPGDWTDEDQRKFEEALEEAKTQGSTHESPKADDLSG